MKVSIYKTEIEDFCKKAIERFRPACIILHGSIARGTYTGRSDVDLIIIGGQLNPNFLKRLSEINKLQDGKTPFEVLGYTLEEWEEMMSYFHLTTLEALQWGIPLHGETHFAQWHARFEHWKSLGLQRGKTSWYIPPHLDKEFADTKAVTPIVS
jgi:predicted nucleotidyltransferase